MGYVGLTMSVVMAKKGFKIYGIEINKDSLDKLQRGVPPFQEKGLSMLYRNQRQLGNIEISETMPGVPIDNYIITVGTPLIKGTKTPNVDYVNNSAATVAKHMKPGALVIMRSTIPVGLCRETVIPELEKNSGMKVGKDFFFAYCPERTIEGNALAELEHNPQIIGGYDAESVRLASDLFRKLTPTIVAVSSIEAAEMVKNMDNSFRDVRFAYANEIALLCEKLGLDAHECIAAANCNYPRNSIPVPSPGVGGACLSKDPHILRYFAQKNGYEPGLITESRRINESIPPYIVDRVSSKLVELNKDIASSKIFIGGFAFKGQPETSDLRDSTTLLLLEELQKYARNIYGFDPVVSPQEIAQFGVKPCTLEEGYTAADVVMLMNNHPIYQTIDPFDISAKMNKPGIVYDSWRMLQHHEILEENGLIYMSVGK